MNNMTALVSCFARAYHFRMNQVRIFSDEAAYAVLNEDYDRIAENMMQGKDFFLPGFKGSAEDALRMIADRQLSPSVLGRSAFAEQMLEEAVSQGCGQYLILAAGYDTYGIRNRNSRLTVFEADLPDMLSDKQNRIQNAGLETCSVDVPCDLSAPSWTGTLSEKGFDRSKRTFVSLLGISYYLSEEAFSGLIRTLNEILPEHSQLCFDVPTADEGREAGISRQLAQGAGETMQVRYSPARLNEILNRNGFSVIRMLDHREMTERFFSAYNQASDGHHMEAPQGVCYVLAERK